jgi:NADH-quinone oxidoreductase subunit K
VRAVVRTYLGLKRTSINGKSSVFQTEAMGSIPIVRSPCLCFVNGCSFLYEFLMFKISLFFLNFGLGSYINNSFIFFYCEFFKNIRVDFTLEELTYFIKKHTDWMVEQVGVVPPSVQFVYSVLFPFVLFTIGLFGFIFNRSHLILTIISAELILLGSFLNFAYASHILNDPKGQIYAILVLVIAAAESAIGLSLIVNNYVVKKNIDIGSLRFLRG